MLEAETEAVNGINMADELVDDNPNRRKQTGTEVMEKQWYHNIIVYTINHKYSQKLCLHHYIIQSLLIVISNIYILQSTFKVET